MAKNRRSPRRSTAANLGPKVEAPNNVPPPLIVFLPTQVQPVSKSGNDRVSTVPAYLLPLNFVALGAVVTGMLMWCYYYTDWFEGITTLLGLGGVLGGIATLFRAVSKDRLEATQKLLTEEIFDRHRTWMIALGAGAVFLIAISALGSIQIDHQAGTHTWMVRTALQGQSLPAVGDAVPIQAGGKLRKVYLTWPWQATSVQIKVTGLPSSYETIWPWSRRRIACPIAFLRPIVLIAPSRTVMMTQKKLNLVLSIDGRQVYDAAYDSHVVILGSPDADIAYPASLQSLEDWKDIVGDATLSTRLHPGAAVRVDCLVKPKQLVTATLLESDGTTKYSTVSYVTEQPTDASDLVQPFILKRVKSTEGS